MAGGLVWDGSECEEINLWTYWHGKGSYSPNVVVVGQDWRQIISYEYKPNVESALNPMKNGLIKPICHCFKFCIRR